MGAAEVSATVGRQKRHVVDLRFRGKASLSEWGIDADGIEIDLRIETIVLFTEVLGLLLGYFRIKRGDHTDDVRVDCCLGKVLE